MSPIALAILAAVKGIIVAAPDAIAAADAVRKFVSALFTSKVITAVEQNELFGHVSVLCIVRLRGELPASWMVEPDPK